MGNLRRKVQIALFAVESLPASAMEAFDSGREVEGSANDQSQQPDASESAAGGAASSGRSAAAEANGGSDGGGTGAVAAAAVGGNEVAGGGGSGVAGGGAAVGRPAPLIWYVGDVFDLLFDYFDYYAD